jgi:hypothetical protein
MPTKTLMFVVLMLSLSACSRGPHVSNESYIQYRWVCLYSPTIFNSDRTVAVCDTEKECNEICSKLPRP